jgi:multisubunit Na+/H+ antiporter MnhB subunit
MNSVILKAATRLMVGLMLVFSVYLLLRGHHEPGGGFAAAIVAGTAFALFSIAEGPGKVRHAIRLSPKTLSIAGLGLAMASGMPAVLQGRPFLSGVWFRLGSDWFLGTPLLFDTGVFLSVLGAILALLLALEEN